MPAKKIYTKCRVTGCKAPHKARGFCVNHYALFRGRAIKLSKGI